MLFRTKRIYSICCVLIVLIFQGCSRLPKDFSSQSLEEKIEIYANYIEKTGQTDLTLAAYVKIGYEHRNNVGEAYKPTAQVEARYDVKVRA